MNERGREEGVRRGVEGKEEVPVLSEDNPGCNRKAKWDRV